MAAPERAHCSSAFCSGSSLAPTRRSGWNRCCDESSRLDFECSRGPLKETLVVPVKPWPRIPTLWPILPVAYETDKWAKAGQSAGLTVEISPQYLLTARGLRVDKTKTTRLESTGPLPQRYPGIQSELRHSESPEGGSPILP